MYEELIESLRACGSEDGIARCVYCHEEFVPVCNCSNALMRKAADAIEELQKAVNFHKPITNYDRIISKSPEELARWFYNIMDCSVCPVDCTKQIDGVGCEDHWLDWLKQEADHA